MHRDGPDTHLPVKAVPAWKLGLHACWLVLLGGALLATSALAAPAEKKAPATADAAQFVGGETCATCHEEVAKNFAGNPHAKLAATHGTKGISCESCHGPGKEHVDGGGDTSKIFNPAKASAKEVDDKCLGCHQGQHAKFETSAHGEANVSCISCHSVHQDSKGEKVEHLLKAPQTKLCFQCHTDVKPQFSMPFHHKVNEGVVQCSDCHDVHGANDKHNLKSAATQDAVCTKCHTETAGPFVYEHAAIKTEGCTACHQPHGGPNPRLLTKPSVNQLCLECHSPSPNFTAEVPGHSQNGASYNTCTICHTAIHGSNYNKRFAVNF